MKVKLLFVFSTTLLSMILFGCTQKSDNPKKPYHSEEAIKHGDIVDEHGVISNLDRLNKFMKNVNNGVKDKVRITGYTTEGDPIFNNLDYNGKEIKYTYDDSQDSYGGSGIKSDTCSNIESANIENGVEYRLNNCSSEVGKNFIFKAQK
jgi:hypothetical protein